MNRPKQVTKEMHHDYELEFVPETLIRNRYLTPKSDEKGLRVNYTQAELDEHRAPSGAPERYTATPADLVPGTIVEVIVIQIAVRDGTPKGGRPPGEVRDHPREGPSSTQRYCQPGEANNDYQNEVN